MTLAIMFAERNRAIVRRLVLVPFLVDWSDHGCFPLLWDFPCVDARFLRTTGEIISGPAALFGFRESSIFFISLLVTVEQCGNALSH